MPQGQFPSDEASARAASLARVTSAYKPAFSPDGRAVAFVSDMGGLPQVWTLALEGGWPVRVTALDDPVSLVKWSPDGAWLAVDVAPGGGMNRQTFIVRPDGSGLRQITGGGRTNNWLGAWSADSQSLILSSNQRDPASMDVCRVDLATGAVDLLLETPAGTATFTDVAKDRADAIAHCVSYRGSSDLALVDLNTGNATVLTPHAGPGTYAAGAFSPDAQAICLAADHQRDRVAFCRMTRDAQGRFAAVEVLAGRDDADLQEFSLAPDGRTAALVWNTRGGRSQLQVFDLDARVLHPPVRLPGEVIHDLGYSPDGRLLIFTAESPAQPRDIWLLDPHTGETRQLTFSQHPGVDMRSLVHAELVSFSAPDGLELTGWLYRPPAFTLPGPLVLSFHGGPEGQEIPDFNPTYQALAAHGIAVLAPNVRGSGGFGKAFVNLDNGPLRANAIRDIRACVDFVVAAGIADARRIGIMGGSYGGYMTMAGLSSYPDLFAAGVNIYGVVNFRTFFAQTERWMAAISKVEYGDPDTETEMLDGLSPMMQIERVIAPTLVIHGLNDTNVPVAEAEQTVAALQRQRVAVEYVLFPDEGHGFLKEPNRVRATTATVGWFLRHLNATSDSPAMALPAIPAEALPLAEMLSGLQFTPAERELMLGNLRENRASYEQIRSIAIGNHVAPALAFDPRVPGMPPVTQTQAPSPAVSQPIAVPADLEEVAFWPVTHLAELIRTRQVTSVALTGMYLQRLKRFDPKLLCVITLTEDLALEQAARADQEIASGRYRGVLHGIPYGLKDLLAVRGTRTTWGAEPYIDQTFDDDATVVERLEAAGAVLLAKLTVGALAWGDVWFGGMTRNPWNVEEGSSGSSAGSASAVSAGLVGFAIGTETYGSIVSPATQCRVSGMRPTFGRVSRHGAMALSWSMDKIGPICRTVEDCAHVFNAIHGADGRDLTAVDQPFNWNPHVRLEDLRVGYVKSAFEHADENHSLGQESLRTLAALGAELIPVELPDYPVDALNFILTAEAAAAFDELTRSNRDDLLSRQIRDAWPNTFRQARFIPAVEYIQANRVRRLMMEAMQSLMSAVDVYVAPSFTGHNLLLTNLTGHPAVVVPSGVGPTGTPYSLTFTGRLYDEASALAVAMRYQQATEHHLRHPQL